SLVYDRFFCKYACPMGGLLALLSRLSVFKVRRDPETCIDCGACDRACPVNVDVASARTVSSAECIGCAECVNACPAPGALTLATARGTRISPLRLTLVTLGVFAGVIVLGTIAGQFAWTQPTLAGEAAAADKAGETLDTSTIKGSTTMTEVSSATGIPAQELGSAFDLSPEEMDLPLKEVKDVKGFTMEQVREYVSSKLEESGP
ncbi:4Fe-4S dicluster domain-containing protein, partial [bacterium]|nr:4Fe-4S dicluster domain-containing protein [bacterium]